MAGNKEVLRGNVRLVNLDTDIAKNVNLYGSLSSKEGGFLFGVLLWKGHFCYSSIWVKPYTKWSKAGCLAISENIYKYHHVKRAQNFILKCYSLLLEMAVFLFFAAHLYFAFKISSIFSIGLPYNFKIKCIDFNTLWPS